jgi:hypothetical protein
VPDAVFLQVEDLACLGPRVGELANLFMGKNWMFMGCSIPRVAAEGGLVEVVFRLLKEPDRGLSR